MEQHEDVCHLYPFDPYRAKYHDTDQLERGKERFRNCQYRKRDDEAEMQKHVDSNWIRKLPRW